MTDYHDWESTYKNSHLWPYRWRSERLLDLEETFAINDWCKEHCRGEWRVSVSSQIWSFRNSQDYMMFTLRWGDK